VHVQVRQHIDDFDDFELVADAKVGVVFRGLKAGRIEGWGCGSEIVVNWVCWCDVLPSSGRDRSLSAIVSDRPIVALEME
jgi:hypothetical protein